MQSRCGPCSGACAAEKFCGNCLASWHFLRCAGRTWARATSPCLTVLLSRAFYVPGSLEKNKRLTGCSWSLTPCLVRAGARGSCPNCHPPQAAATPEEPRAAVQPDARQANRQMTSPVVRAVSPQSCCAILSEMSSLENNGPCKEAGKRHPGQTPSDAACDCN